MPSLNLVADVTDKVKEGPVPAEVRINLRGHRVEVTSGQKVKIGTKVAGSPVEGCGDAHSPIAGEVIEAGEDCISIRATGGSEAEEPVKVAGTAEELKKTLSSLGVDTAKLTHAATLVINGLNSEPTISVAQQILRDYVDTVKAGLDIVRKIVSPDKVILAVMRGASASLDGITVKEVEPVYPASVDELVVKAVTGEENPEGGLVVSVDELYNIGALAQTGMPFTERIMTIAGKNYRVKLGTPVSYLLPLAGVEAGSKDRVIFGGPMRGLAQYTMLSPVEKNTTGFLVIRKGEFPPVTSDACLNCGECTRRCPARLQASLIARYAEFCFFEEAKNLDLDSCFECGMCAYWCPARRPLLQYIRFAKVEYEKLMEARAAAEAAEKAAAETPGDEGEKKEEG